jgi:hypothetical protein
MNDNASLCFKKTYAHFKSSFQCSLNCVVFNDVPTEREFQLGKRRLWVQKLEWRPNIYWSAKEVRTGWAYCAARTSWGQEAHAHC